MSAKFFVFFLFVVLAAGLVFATDYECEFDYRANVNCSAVGAAETFCQLAGPGPVANNPAVPTTCITNTPATPGKVICTLKNYNGPANSIRCSNTPSYVRGPDAVGGAVSGGCPYNDCELNQISCASAFAYQKCVVDSSDPRCNKWQATNCVANAPCRSSTPAELAVCAGLNSNQIESRNGVYFVVSGSPPAGGQPAQPVNNAGGKGSYTYNGKTYYVVTSTDSSLDTGNEVCASVGKKCVGYTGYATDICKYFHPDATVTTTVNGSKAGFYCNGPPQTGLACGTSFNNCQICPACNVNMDCSTPIGNLFREMYVECGTGQNPFGNFVFFGFGDGTYNAEIQNYNGSTTVYTFDLQNGQITNYKEGVLGPSAKGTFRTSATVLDTIKNSSDPAKEAVNQLKNDGIQYFPNNLIDHVWFFFFRLFLNFR